ncbi:MAG: peptide ABC transporter permease, partial [Telmatospirillum sp.]|nr:peptide ABC transporter permease [Telmatospirillum sp.]
MSNTAATTAEAEDAARLRAGRKRAWQRFMRNRGAVAGAIVLIAWSIVALLGVHVVAYDPTEMLGLPRQPPSAEFWFGTDLLGRDIFSRVLVGSQVSLQLGLISVGLGAVPGV